MNHVTERRIFKLPTGYLHVDGGGLSFTRSGNWSEAATVKERGGLVHAVHLVRVVLGVAMIGTGMVLYALMSLHLKGAMAFTIAVAGAAWSIYRYINRLQDDFTQTFRIPFAKVRSLHSADGRLTITFVNGNWKEDEVKMELDAEQRAWIQSAWDAHRKR